MLNKILEQSHLERIKYYYNSGPIQRAVLEDFVDVILEEVDLVVYKYAKANLESDNMVDMLEHLRKEIKQTFGL